MPPRDIDYSVYLVTDSTPAVLGAGRNVVDVVAAALRDAPGAIGVVQLREKHADARTMLTTLAALHAHTAAAGVPLLVNDRVDVAVAALARGHCEGVHLGQDDLDPATARRMLGPAAVVGVTASTPHEAVAACRAGADYLGLGTVFATPTKTDTKHVVGPAGVQRMLQAVGAAGFGHVPALCIGGVHAGNARRVLFQSTWPGGPGGPRGGGGGYAEPVALRGVAVVSAIMGAADPGAAAAALAEQVRLGREGPTAFYRAPPPPPAENAHLLQLDPKLLSRIVSAVGFFKPLSHNMTNLVVQNLAANVALAIGASPIMSNSGAEAADLARIPGSTLVVNMGTVSDASLAAFTQAIAAYNAAGRPVVFDPVGAGATDLRCQAVRTIMHAGYIDVIKGNEAEIQTVYHLLFRDPDVDGAEDDDARPGQRGVDGAKVLTDPEARSLVANLARRARCVVVMTGPTDYISDSTGRRVVALACGDPIMAQVTGTGCALGTVLSATVAAAACCTCSDRAPPPGAFEGAVAGVALYGHAAEAVVGGHDDPAGGFLNGTVGPGAFVPAFLDALAAKQSTDSADREGWMAQVLARRA